MTAQIILERGRQRLERVTADKRIRILGAGAGHILAGLVVSAASLGNYLQPFALGLIAAAPGWHAAALALGAAVGYPLFWGVLGNQGLAWVLAALVIALLPLGRRGDPALLRGALASFAVSASGLCFQLLGMEETPVGMYYLRIVLAGGAVFLFCRVAERRSPVADALGLGVGVLALAQVAPVPWLRLGHLAAAAAGAGGPLPVAVISGLALDLAGVSRVPMAAVLSAGCLVRLVPGERRWIRCAAPAAIYTMAMALLGIWEPSALPALVLGGLAGSVLTPRPETLPRRGPTGMAQVRLELMASALGQTQQLLLESAETPIDEDALLARTRERACGGCPHRKGCRDLGPIPREVLTATLSDGTSLGFPCRKTGRMLQELRRTQEQLRSMKADRRRQAEYRQAVIQQYRFLGSFLRQLADDLPKRQDPARICYKAQVAVATAGKQAANGDRCQSFAGVGSTYYVILCDGMGTGLGAAQEGQTALTMLRQMLSAGFPAEYALRSLNSLCCLRGKAAAVTVDLAELRLDSGKVSVYKWGAAPSWLLSRDGAEKIGTAGPPPGIHAAEAGERVERLSLRRGETLILVSDGVEGEKVLRRLRIAPDLPPGELAAELVEPAAVDGEDDATAVVIRLHPANLST